MIIESELRNEAPGKVSTRDVMGIYCDMKAMALNVCTTTFLFSIRLGRRCAFVVGEVRVE